MKKLSLFASLYLSFACAACAQTSAIDVHATVDAQLRTNKQMHGIPGQAVLVLHNNDILYRNATGTTAIEDGTPITPKSVFPVYSVSKLFAITLIMQLHEEGKLDISAPASRYERATQIPTTW